MGGLERSNLFTQPPFTPGGERKDFLLLFRWGWELRLPLDLPWHYSCRKKFRIPHYCPPCGLHSHCKKRVGWPWPLRDDKHTDSPLGHFWAHLAGILKHLVITWQWWKSGLSTWSLLEGTRCSHSSLLWCWAGVNHYDLKVFLLQDESFPSLWLEKKNLLSGFFLSVLVCVSGLEVSSDPSLVPMKEKENSSNSLPCHSLDLEVPSQSTFSLPLRAFLCFFLYKIFSISSCTQQEESENICLPHLPRSGCLSHNNSKVQNV